MPSYFNKGIEHVKAAEHRIEKLPEPNKQYAKDFGNYLQVSEKTINKLFGKGYIEKKGWLSTRYEFTPRDIKSRITYI